jgi:hypothetical protein
MLSLQKDANEMMVLGTSFASKLHGKSERSISKPSGNLIVARIFCF